jgi:hypothetical protein
MRNASSSSLRGGSNDACANASGLSVNAPGTCAANAVAGDNGFATQDGVEPDCDATDTQFQDVWYTFNSGPNTDVMIDFTLGTIEDIVLEVYSGGCSGTTVYCDLGPTHMVAVTADTDYTVRVSSNNDFGVGGTFTICVSSLGAGTGNDLCNDATPIAVGSSCVGTTGTVENATQSLPGALCSGFTATVANDVWYTFTATAASTTVQVTGDGDATTGVDAILEVFSGNCDALVSLGCVDATTRGGTETLVVATTAGVTYYYRIYQWPYAAPQTVFGITTCVFSAGSSAAPVNDLCANATSISVGSNCVGTAGTVENATQSVAGALCSGFTATVANDVWYTFTATAASTTVSVTGAGDATTGVDPILEVFSGNCAALVSLGCVDATTRGGTESLVVATIAGVTYYYRIYQWPYATPQTVFGFTTCVFNSGPTPPNDLCTGAVPQDLEVGNTVTYTGDNTGATALEGTEFLVVWEAFTLSSCATVTVNYCVTGSVFEDFLVNLATQCPDVLTGLQTGTVANNCTVTFTELQAGTYYIPVLVDPLLTPVGAYTISASAVACPVGYCSASATSVNPDFEKISNVAFAGINNPSTLPDGYEDFTSVVGNVTQGSSQDITVTISNGFADDQVLVWIDFDQSESFEPGELVYTSPLGVGPHTGPIVVPGNALLGQTRMRIRLHDSVLGGNTAPCGTSTYGQVEDYTINISAGGPTPPNDLCTGAVPQDLEVGNTVTYTGDNTGATVLEGTEFVVVWEAFTLSTCATVTVNYCVPGSVFEDFLVNLATQCPDVLTGLQTGTVANNCTVTFIELQPGTYYIPVLVDPLLTPVGPYTITASAVACPVGYCSASATDVNPNFEKISNVAFADINNPSTSPVGYEDFTAVVGNVTQGSSQDITVTIANGFADDQVLVWIDFDQSESFEPGELVYTSPLGVGPHTGTIAIPVNASLGQTRMRIRLHDSVLGGNTAPCGTSTYGQVEDYTINIDISTGLSEVGSLDLGVYPNPSNGDLFVRHNIDGPVVLDVLDIAGHVVYSAQRSLVSGEVAQLPLAGKLAAGTYILRVTGENIRGEQRVVVY